MRVLGIDPGSRFCGYGIVKGDSGKLLPVTYGVIRAASEKEFTQRLGLVFREIEEIIKIYQPEALSIESVFYSKNAQSLAKLSHARAAAILPAVINNIPVFEYSPREIKKAVTGNGNASKEQVRYMVKNLLSLDFTEKESDLSDAIAIALCHKFSSRLSQKGKKSSWKEFIKDNPDRIV